MKDNRILPYVYLPLEERERIASALGAGEDLAEDAGAHVGDDEDYKTGGGDTLRYQVHLPSLARPAAVRATLYYQATPPFYLQDRFCTSGSEDTRRLRFIAGRLNLRGTSAQNWKLKINTDREVLPPELRDR